MTIATQPQPSEHWQIHCRPGAYVAPVKGTRHVAGGVEIQRFSTRGGTIFVKVTILSSGVVQWYRVIRDGEPKGSDE